MLLSSLTVNPKRFQFRDNDYSPETVAGILAEGIKPAKFDPLPVIRIEGGLFCVAGDGHSRFESVRRLAELNRLPEEWRLDDATEEFDIPCRIVDEGEARRLAWTANLGATAFKPAEEAKVYKSMIDAGLSVDEIAAMAHKSTHYVRRMLPINELCRDIRDALGMPETDGGIDKYIAQAMAEQFQRYSVDVTVQQRLWHDIFKQISLTPQLVRETMKRIGPKLQGLKAAAGDSMLFALPPSVTGVVREMKGRADDLRRATRGLAWLVQCVDSGILDDLAGLGDWVRHHGKASLDQLKQAYAADADVLAELVG